MKFDVTNWKKLPASDALIGELDADLLSVADQRIIRLLPALRQTLEESLAPQLKARLTSDDLVQETFLRASKGYHLATFANDQMVFAWLKQIAMHIAISSIRSRKSQVELQARSNFALADELFDSGDVTPSELIKADENREILSICLCKLKDSHQRVLRMRYFERISFADIGDRLGITESAARGLHRNAITALRKAIGSASKFFSK